MRIGAYIEHRQGKIRDITFELLTKARSLGETVAVLLGKECGPLTQELNGLAHKILLVEDDRLRDFNPEYQRMVLTSLIRDQKFDIFLLGQTATGLELAPALAQDLGLPIATDCIDLAVEAESIKTTRNIYGGKINTEARIPTRPAIITLRPATFSPESAELATETVSIPSPLTAEIDVRKFLEYVEAEVGEVDITKSDVVVAVGRGIREEKNLPMIEELAQALGGVVACTRPVVDAGWLPKDRQVGSSGKTVKPKLYIAIGISGAFQHIMGMRGSGTIIAINKDPEAPIFNEADYGIVDDLFKVVPILKEKIKELKG